MSAPNPSTAQAAALIDELARGGVRRAVISPGSRSTALAIAAEGHPDIEVAVSIDERSAGFFALGSSRVARRPAVVISTSGTAAANHFPAVVEADAAVVPLIVVSADRPPELRGVGANQTIDQRMLFGGKVRWYVEVGVAEDRPDADAYWRSAASRAVAEALGLGGPPGPVHMNVAFREPTVPLTDDGRSTAIPFSHPTDGREGSTPWTAAARSSPKIEESVLDSLPLSGQGVVIAGEGVATPTRLVAAAGELGWPVLATAQSGARLAGSISTYHHLLELPGFLDRLAPDFVIRVGRTGPSPRLDRLYAHAAPQIVVDTHGRWLDHTRTADHLVAADPTDLLEALVERVDPASEGWLESWIEVDGVVRAALDRALDADPSLTEPRVARDLAAVPWVTLAVASSGPIRDVDAHLATGGRVIGNRGASGIDGFVSMALGAASESAPLVALSGDLSMLHDGNGFLIDPSPPAVFVIVNNNGGGLFYELPQARLGASFERLFLTPHGRDFEQLAAFHDIGYARVEEPSQFPKAVLDAQRAGGVQLVEAPTDAKAGADLRRRLDEVAAIAWSG